MKRQANIELLRGVLMFMIVMVHLTGNGVLDDKNPISYLETNWLIANLIDAICYPAVNCFILISGYFGLRPTIRKFMILDVPIILYGIIIFLLLDNYSVGGWVRALFPVLSNSYWFLTNYFLLLIAAPFLNSIIECVDKRKLHIILLITLLLFVLIPSLTIFRLAEPRGMDFISFSVLYLIGRYIKINDLRLTRRTSAILYILSTILCFTLTVIMAYLMGINHGWKSHFYAYNNVLVYIQAISLFLFFRQISLGERICKVVCYLSPSFFYIYIIHEAPAIHYNLYSWINSNSYYYSEWFWLHTLISAIVVFCICLLIDIILRRFLASKLIEKIVIVLENFSYLIINRVVVLIDRL